MTREEAIEEVKNYDNYPNGLSKECRDYIIKALEQEPTPVRIKGHWIGCPSKNKEQGEVTWWKCSECGQVVYSETEGDRKEFQAFCSRCGTDMRGNTKRKREPIEGNNESYNCENWIP